MDTFLMVLPCYTKSYNYILCYNERTYRYLRRFKLYSRINYIMSCCTRAISLINVDLYKKIVVLL